jgi:hypothetical protein
VHRSDQPCFLFATNLATVQVLFARFIGKMGSRVRSGLLAGLEGVIIRDRQNLRMVLSLDRVSTRSVYAVNRRT